MCKFCDLLKNNGTLKWKERSTFADDNLCEIASGEDMYTKCEGCNGCDKRGFELTSYASSGDVRVGVSYFRKPHGVEVSPFTEPIPFSFCPFCGEQVSKNIKEFNENDWRYAIKEE